MNTPKNDQVKSKWELERDQERERSEAMHAKIKEACNILHFRQDRTNDNWDHGGYIEISPTSKVRLFYRVDLKTNRIEVSFSTVPDCKINVHDLTTYEERQNGYTREITLSATKSPQQIARDIERRLLPIMRDFEDRLLARLAEKERYASAVAANQSALKKAWPLLKESHKANTLYKWVQSVAHCTIEVFDGSCNIELKYLSPDLACKVAKLLANECGTTQEE